MMRRAREVYFIVAASEFDDIKYRAIIYASMYVYIIYLYVWNNNNVKQEIIIHE